MPHRALLYLQSMRRYCLQSCGRRGSLSSRQRTAASHGQGHTMSGAVVAPARSCKCGLNGVHRLTAMSSNAVRQRDLSTYRCCAPGTINGSCTACPLWRHTASVRPPMLLPMPSCKLGLMLHQPCMCCASQKHPAARYVRAWHSHVCGELTGHRTASTQAGSVAWTVWSCDLQVTRSAGPEAVAAAELQLGLALAAEPGHADRDAFGAAKVVAQHTCTHQGRH